MDLLEKIYSSKFFSRIFHTVRHCLITELEGSKRILDLGCGPDSPIQYVPGIEYSLGVEGHKANLVKSKNKKIHNEYYFERIENFKINKKSFDAVMLIEVIEHLSKEAGRQVLDKAESWAREKIVVTTPNGLVEQGELFGNKLEKHVSGWDVAELKKLGFKVRGLAGFKFLRKARRAASKNDNLLSSIRWRPKIFWFAVAALSQLFVYYMPSLAFELLAVKNISKARGKLAVGKADLDSGTNKKVTIIIPTVNRGADVVELIESIKKSDYSDYLLVVIDDGSTQNISEIIAQKFFDVEVLRNEKNIGAAASRNRGMREYMDKSEYLLFLDSDETVASDTIRLMVETLEKNKEIAMVTPSVYYYDKPELLQYGEAGVNLWTGVNYSGSKEDGLDPKQVRMCGGNFMMRSHIIRQIGFMDERYHVFYEDADYSYRAVKAGFKLIYAPKAKVYHKTPILDADEATRKWLGHAYLTARNKIIFMKKHGKSFLVFMLFYPLYFFFYMYKALQFRDFKAMKEYLRGMSDGFFK